uniref:Uncharacterized protein n=1 Tax=Micrurus spixii TaxID=129469 RepID=A0A2D4LQU9_9SAUR
MHRFKGQNFNFEFSAYIMCFFKKKTWLSLAKKCTYLFLENLFLIVLLDLELNMNCLFLSMSTVLACSFSFFHIFYLIDPRIPCCDNSVMVKNSLRYFSDYRIFTHNSKN